MLRPRLLILYNARQNAYVRVTALDLARETADQIKSVCSPGEFGIELSNFI